jgi:hypothetical protein
MRLRCKIIFFLPLFLSQIPLHRRAKAKSSFQLDLLSFQTHLLGSDSIWARPVFFRWPNILDFLLPIEKLMDRKRGKG